MNLKSLQKRSNNCLSDVAIAALLGLLTAALLLVGGCSQESSMSTTRITVIAGNGSTNADGVSSKANLGAVVSIGYWYKQESDKERVTGTETGEMTQVNLDKPLGEHPHGFSLAPPLSDQLASPALLHIVGFNDHGTPLGYWHGALPVLSDKEQQVTLEPWKMECDRDGDLFPDCSQQHCCPLLHEQEGLATSLGDCIDSGEYVLEHATLFMGDELDVARNAHPFFSGDMESQDPFLCRDGLDNNCDGREGPCQGDDADDGGASDDETPGYVRVEELTLHPTAITLTVGDSFNLTPSFTPENPTDSRIIWSSSAPAIVDIERQTGTMRAMDSGTATIQAVSMDGDRQAEATIKVLSAPESITLSNTELVLAVGESQTLTATVTPDDAADRRIELTSGNTEVATIDQDGVVQALATGSTVITAATVRGSLQAECQLTVKAMYGDGSAEAPFGTHPPAASCLEYKTNHQDAVDGHFLIARNQAELVVWCDMTTDGGGYTYRKVNLGYDASASAAEAHCQTMGMRLFIPRTPGHIAAAWSVATNGNIAPDGNAHYLYIMGIYPKYYGAQCKYRSLASTTEGCNWEAGDRGRFYVSDRIDINEPNGDNSPGCSMGYDFNPDGSIAWYNDERYPGYRSSRFICDTADKQ